MNRTRSLIQIATLAAVATLVGACGDGGDGSEPAPGSDARLALLVLEQITLEPDFAANTQAYSAVAANSVSSTRVTPTAADPTATLQVNGASLASGATSAPIALVEGANTLAIAVTARNGATTRTYTVTVTRRAPPASNANVASLALSVGPLEQIFDPALTAYTASVGHLGTSTRVVATPEDANASLALNGAVLDHGAPSGLVLLATGSNALTLLATAEDAATTSSYTVDVTRGSLAAVRQEAYIKASNAGQDLFGSSLAVRGDVLVAGAPDEDSGATGIGGTQNDDSQSNAGAAYLFARNGNDWAQADYVKASNAEAGDTFGAAVALDHNLFAAGAPGEDSAASGIGGSQTDDAAAAAGAVYAFTRDSSGDWRQAAYLKASNAQAGDRFGSPLSLDRDRLLVSAPLEDSRATGVAGDQSDNTLADAGAAYLFGRDGVGTWRQLAYLKATNTGSRDEFGRSVTLSDTALAVGAPGEDSSAAGVDGAQDDNSLRDSGAVYVFAADAGGTWAPAAYVKAANPGAFDTFGTAVALDDNLLAVGSPGQNSNARGVDGDELDQSMQDAGAVYVFQRDTSGRWAQDAYIKASRPGEFDEFGTTVALRGNLLAVGAPGQNSSATGLDGDELDESMLNAGAVYLFQRDVAGRWSQVAYVKASNTDAGDAFGGTIAIDGDTLATGAALEDSASTGINGDETDNGQRSTGAVYVVR